MWDVEKVSVLIDLLIKTLSEIDAQIVGNMCIASNLHNWTMCVLQCVCVLAFFPDLRACHDQENAPAESFLILTLAWRIVLLKPKMLR